MAPPCPCRATAPAQRLRGSPSAPVCRSLHRPGPHALVLQLPRGVLQDAFLHRLRKLRSPSGMSAPSAPPFLPPPLLSPSIRPVRPPPSASPPAVPTSATRLSCKRRHRSSLPHSHPPRSSRPRDPLLFPLLLPLSSLPFRWPLQFVPLSLHRRLPQAFSYRMAIQTRSPMPSATSTSRTRTPVS